MKKCNFGIITAVSTILLGGLLLASAQENSDKTKPDTTVKKGEGPEASRDLEALPDFHSPSWVPFKQEGKELRVVGISPQLRSSANYIRGIRFHRLLGALAERETPIEDGLPNVIDGIRRNLDGSVWLRFRVIVTTPEFQKRCRDAVLAQERALLLEEKLTQDDIRIEPWPLKHCVVSMQDSFSKEILAVSQTGTLTGTKEEFNFTMQFSPEDLRKVLALIGKGEIEFVYTYSYVGSTEYHGEVDLKGVKNAKLIAGQTLRSEQIEGKEPIFQSEANEAVRHLNVSVQKTMRATHKEIIALLDQPNLFQKLFADDGEITFKDLKAGDEMTALMLAAYLKPHLEQVRDSYGGEKSDIKIHEDKLAEGNSSGSSVNAGIGLPLPLPIPISLSFGGGISNSTMKTKEVLDRIEQATGSKWAYDQATERFRPHSVKKLKFQSGADQVLIDEKTTVFLSVGAENRYLEDTPIPVTFTTKIAGMKSTVAQGSDLGPYEGVPLGAVIPFFGSNLPKGYRWFDRISEDPKNVFPNADWVPQHLRGLPLPDMRGEILGGAKVAQDVGQLWPGFTLDFSVDGSHFTVPEGKKTTESIETNVMKWTKGWATPYQFFCRSTPKKDESWAGMSIIDSLTSSYLIYSGSVAGSAPVSVKVEKVPRHVMCRWIIRIE